MADSKISALTPITSVADTDAFVVARSGASNQITGVNLRKSIRIVFNVKDFGAVGDSTTDDSAAIQSAINACDVNRGGTVFFPQGRYRIATGLTVTNPGTHLLGEGLPGTSRAQAQGSSRIISDNGIDAITFNPGTTPTHGTLGYRISQLHVLAASGATTGNGIIVQNVMSFRAEDVTVSDYIGGVGLLIDGKTGNSQYATLVNFSAGDCLNGLKTQGTGPNGLRMFGGYFEGQGQTPRTGSIGINLTTGDTSRLFGVVVQGYETGAYIQSAAVAHEMHGPRFEYCNICLRIGGSASKFTLFGGSFTNSLLTGGGSNIGIQIDSGATNVILMPTSIVGTSTSISDSGTGTKQPFNASGGSLTSSSNYVTSDVTMTTAGTFYDGPSLSLAAGTYLLTGAVSVLASTTAIREYTAKLWDGSTTLTNAARRNEGTAQAAKTSIPLSGVVTIGSTTTYKISVTSTIASDTLLGTGVLSSYLVAVKIA